MNITSNVSLKPYTTFRSGGNARFFAEPETEREVEELLDYAAAEGIKTFVLGQGSNILVSDQGFDGLVIKIGRTLGAVEVNATATGAIIRAGAGAPLSLLGSTAVKEGLKGAEFCCGIPGSVGGGVFMNAGAYGGSIADIARKVRYYDGKGIITLDVSECEFGYRRSLFARRENEGLQTVILSLECELERGNKEEILAYTEELKAKRVASQPLDVPSAGSTFKRPEGYFAGKLIEDSGLRGFCLDDSGAQVSPKHCGFIVNNKGTATSSDILKLIDYVIETVYAKQGVRLEREVRLVGDF